MSNNWVNKKSREYYITDVKTCWSFKFFPSCLKHGDIVIDNNVFVQVGNVMRDGITYLCLKDLTYKFYLTILAKGRTNLYNHFTLFWCKYGIVAMNFYEITYPFTELDLCSFINIEKEVKSCSTLSIIYWKMTLYQFLF